MGFQQKGGDLKVDVGKPGTYYSPGLYVTNVSRFFYKKKSCLFQKMVPLGVETDIFFL